MTTQITAERVVTAYLALRDARSVLKRQYEKDDSVLSEKMDKLEGYLAQQLADTGATQLGTTNGTAYRQLNLKPSCGDWGSFWPWAAENGKFDMMEKRLSAKAVKDYFEETSELPPGVSIIQEYKIVVRKR
jgi:hypothetical protein